MPGVSYSNSACADSFFGKSKKLNALWTCWSPRFVALALTASMLLLTGCWRDKHVVYVTGSGYISLEKGQTFTAPRKMTLATEAIVQEKDEQILDLIRVNQALVSENAMLKGR